MKKAISTVKVKSIDLSKGADYISTQRGTAAHLPQVTLRVSDEGFVLTGTNLRHCRAMARKLLLANQ
jgi:hypothetical protein